MSQKFSFTQEPTVSVGIMEAPCIEFSITGRFSGISSGKHSAKVVNGEMFIDDKPSVDIEFRPQCQDSFFTLENVEIGIGFHWQRREPQSFRGSLRLLLNHSNVIAVNSLPVEEYLKSVIASEMSANASLDFLKAHAVLSRSWLLAILQRKEKREERNDTANISPEWKNVPFNVGNNHNILRWYDRDDHLFFDVCADDHCQRYQGISRQSNPHSRKAVEDTRGLVLTYGEEVCDARFSKCCGGTTEEYETCWDDKHIPYLESIADCDSEGHDFCDTADPHILREVLNDYDLETPDFYRWETVYRPEELSQLILSKSGIDLGEITAIKPLKRGRSGRIFSLEIVGTKTSLTVGKELEIRRLLSPSHLKSSNFEAHRLADGNWKFRGRGWGHGVGLCQIGAAVMGACGYDYRQILHHYFPKASLECLY